MVFFIYTEKKKLFFKNISEGIIYTSKKYFIGYDVEKRFTN